MCGPWGVQQGQKTGLSLHALQRKPSLLSSFVILVSLLCTVSYFMKYYHKRDTISFSLQPVRYIIGISSQMKKKDTESLPNLPKDTQQWNGHTRAHTNLWSQEQASFSLHQNSLPIRMSWWTAHMCSRVLMQYLGTLCFPWVEGCGNHSFCYKVSTLSCGSLTTEEIAQPQVSKNPRGWVRHSALSFYFHPVKLCSFHPDHVCI